MFRKQFCSAGWITAVCLSLCPLGYAQDVDRDLPSLAPAKVFILAGQSNMQGHGVVDLDHPERYNGGKGSLVKLLESAEMFPLLKHLRSEKENWTTRDDVWIRYQVGEQAHFGGLTIGFTGHRQRGHHFGPELQFGHVVGNAIEEPVLLIKTAWGGKSLYEDFRPPSSSGPTGPFYEKMLEEIQTGLAQAATDFPALADRELQVCGFVWQQGWNDMINDAAIDEYEQNLLNLISDVRQAVNEPELPFVYGELGNGGHDVSDRMQRFRRAQAKAAQHGDPKVMFVRTASYARPAANSPNPGHGHHWFGNAESYFLVGDALGYGMLKLVAPTQLPKILILGDSISMGYTPTVQEELHRYYVVRPTNERGKPINCQGTTHGVKNIEQWLNSSPGDWDLIHFNFGLHDMKHVDADSGKNSTSADDPLQAPPKIYEAQLREIVAKLKQTDATLIFATTTPVPEGVKPLRETDSPSIYNAIAKKIMLENDVTINDLYEFVLPRIDELQRANDVHFTPTGSRALGQQVANAIRGQLESSSRASGR